MTDYSRRDFLALAGMGLATGFEDAWASSFGPAGPAPDRNAVQPQALPPADLRDLPLSDSRLKARTLNTPCAPPQFDSREQWEKRAARLREQVLTSAGLWPMPERAPLRAEIFDRLEGKGFTVEKVYFESYPGFFCTGNLYRPLGSGHQPPFPGILCPHGHWNYGRLEHSPGNGGVSSLPQRCMNFALQGYVSFAYDMVGYNDSFQVPHRFGSDPHAPWGLSREGLRLGLWGVGVLGLQLWNSIRAVDFLLSLPDVDAERIAATGASGGGTQTFLLTAVDDRVRVSAPVNMISHYMQGGDLCENAPNLRIDTNNMEISALMAPRPMLMVSATGDWTRDTPRVEYPAVASIYALLGAKDRIAQQQFQEPHNYNLSSRQAVYRFFARWLAGEPGRAEGRPTEERGEFSFDPGHLLVFSRREPPAQAVGAQQITESLVADAQRRLTAARPRRVQDLETYRKLFGPVFRTALMVKYPSRDELRWWPVEDQGSPRRHGELRWERLVIGRVSVGDRIPAQLVRPPARTPGVALIVHPEGARAALGTPESPSPLARELSRHGYVLFSVDAFQTGKALDPARRMEGEYFSTYNRTDDVERVQDVLTALAYLETVLRPERIVVSGQDLAGLWGLLARPFLPVSVVMAADVAGFENDRDEAYLERLHIPLLRRAGDFQTAALLAAPSPLLLHNLAGIFVSEAFSETFAMHGVSARLRISKEKLSPAQIAAWLAS